jgi:predicted nucleic-acid-binding protein
VNLATRKPFIASFAMVAVLSIGTILMVKESFSAVIGTLLTALVIIASHKKNVIDAFVHSRQKEHA